MSNIIISQANSNYIMFIKQQTLNLLYNTDKYVLPDYPITSNQQIEMIQFRQALRDYTKLPEIQNYDYTSNLTIPDFPILPSFASPNILNFC